MINEESLDFPKSEAYKDSTQEKMLRGSLRSNVEKYLDQETVVICDSLNYIKGFRYELYCLAWNAQTTLTVVFCDVESEVAKKLNDERDETSKFPVDLFDDYCSRLEWPNPASKIH